MDFNTLKSVVDSDFEAVNQLITDELKSKAPLVGEISRYIIESGGKRLRPLVTLLSAKACGYTGNQHLEIAAIIEFLHTATLLHDDVVDESPLRRGQPSAHQIWGNSASILVGDFLISRAFQLIVRTGNLKILHILGDATNLIAEGEVLQLMNCKNPNTQETDYLKVIEQKTAKMFEAAAQCGGVIAQCDAIQEQALSSYASQLGFAFQLIDDWLDYQGTADHMGKPAGTDLAEGKPTLPIIYAIQHGNTDQKTQLQNVIRQGGSDQLALVQSILINTGALEYTLATALERKQRAILALAPLVDSPYKTALIQLAELAVQRNY